LQMPGANSEANIDGGSSGAFSEFLEGIRRTILDLQRTPNVSKSDLASDKQTFRPTANEGIERPVFAAEPGFQNATKITTQAPHPTVPGQEAPQGDRADSTPATQIGSPAREQRRVRTKAEIRAELGFGPKPENRGPSNG
jgi:hypothetical protein